jgi:hypothetical protein
MHKKKGRLEAAIEQYKKKTLKVYKADPERIVRDARAAERVTGDHTGRWLFELLQNSDDAQATEVLVSVKNEAVYVADNGQGFKPESVGAICGTDFSDKTGGTIGRKGVGFKSVYEVSRNPQVLTVDGEGIEFSPDKTVRWLHDNDLGGEHVPYQWIPFFISWSDAGAQDPHLHDFKAKGFKTVVKLPGLSPEKITEVEQLLKNWPPHALFAFRHLRKVTAPGLEVEVIRNREQGTWLLRDSRGQTPVGWRVAKHTEHPPEDLLKLLGPNERRAVFEDGVSFLIAAPLENDCVKPTEDYLPVHVFYPTEQIGPVRLLLHAEFLVKSDRTAVIPIESNRFNAWVADRLADHVCKFVNDSYDTKAPSSHAALLVPFQDRESHPVANALWQRIAEKAKTDLRLADIEGQQRLTLGEARLISVTVRHDLARTLLEATSVRGQLLHCSFDTDQEARNALRALDCKEIHDRDLMEVIAQNAVSLATNPDLVWACWEWLADWVASKPPYSEEHRKRIESVKALPIVPVNGNLRKPSDLAGRIVTWKPNAGVGNLPDWLPLTFVDDWFRDRIQKEAKEKSAVKRLSEELEIKEPGADVVQRAVGKAIDRYWKDKQGDPGRFLRFILEQDWHETTLPSAELRRCPVPVRGETWAEAEKAYFGIEWGNDLLADLYADIATVAWVADVDVVCDKEKCRGVLQWLGVTHRPRIVNECGRSRICQLPKGCDQWKQYLHTARDCDGRRVEWIATVSKLDHLAIDNLDADRGVLLIRMIAKNWEAYYGNGNEVNAEGCFSRERYYRVWQVKAKWWWEILERLRLPRRDGCAEHVALAALWLPDKRTERAIGDLLPVIDLDAFGNDKDVVRDWLVSAVGLRTRMEQLTVEEWKELLSTRIPGKVPAERLASDEELRYKVMKWYEACLETVAEKEDIKDEDFKSCPLLCRKGNDWKYVSNEPRYLNDDNGLATAFAEDVWLFDISTGSRSHAAKYFGVLSLSQSVNVDVIPGEPQSQLSGDLKDKFTRSLPYVYAWRSSEIKQESAERLSARLKRLKVLVVPTLKASLSLAGVHHEVERRWHVEGDTIYLHKDHQNEAELARALAKALDVRKEADFYENLLRCADDRQRKEKLLSEGMADAEIDKCLREYSRQSDQEEQDESPQTQIEGQQESGISQTPLRDDTQRHYPEQVSIRQAGDTSVESRSEAEPQERDEQPLRLKDPTKTNYDFVSPHGESADIGGGGTGAVGTWSGGRSLTDADKAELEKAGRIIVKRQLEKMGYQVEEMPLENPGFDLRATKNGQELRVEVKAHSGRATIVELTQPEYKEYLGQQEYRWELWNVEHLAERDPSRVRITRYDTIPDDALETRTWRVDLKKCKLTAPVEM